jgi:hypothetical protein
MIRRALLVVLGFVGLSFPLAAQETLDAPSVLTLYRPEIFSTVDSSVLIHDLPVLTLLDGRHLPVSSALGQIGIVPLNLLPDRSLSIAELPKVNAAPVSASVDGKHSPSTMMSSPLNPIYYGGEVGVFYGRWSGKFGGEILQTYMLGEVGNENFHITVGASHEESSVRFPRFRSFEPLNR